MSKKLLAKDKKRFRVEKHTQPWKVENKIAFFFLYSDLVQFEMSFLFLFLSFIGVLKCCLMLENKVIYFKIWVFNSALTEGK